MRVKTSKIDGYELCCLGFGRARMEIGVMNDKGIGLSGCRCEKIRMTTLC